MNIHKVSIYTHNTYTYRIDATDENVDCVHHNFCVSVSSKFEYTFTIVVAPATVIIREFCFHFPPQINKHINKNIVFFLQQRVFVK